jgi:hypothetical protein
MLPSIDSKGLPDLSRLYQLLISGDHERNRILRREIFVLWVKRLCLPLLVFLTGCLYLQYSSRAGRHPILDIVGLIIVTADCFVCILITENPERAGIIYNLSNKRARKAIERLRKCILTETQFGLYLRQFTLETFATSSRVRIPPTPLGGPPLRIERPIRRLDEDELMERVPRELAVFALTNPQDASASKRLSLLFVHSEDWPEAVTILIRHAAFYLVRVSHTLPEASGITMELNIIRGERRQNRAFILYDVGTDVTSDEQLSCAALRDFSQIWPNDHTGRTELAYALVKQYGDTTAAAADC